MKAWYFSTIERKLRYGDDRDIAIGATHTVEGDPVPCEHGLHGSVKILDALQYAPGPVVWEVELGGKMVEHEDHDKWAATERIYLSGGIDITDTLRAFARRCALDVAELWAMPTIVRQYLETGEKSIRDAANRDAADRAAAWAAANRDAVRDSVRDSAWDAAWTAANRDAARAAAWAAANRAAARAAADAAGAAGAAAGAAAQDSAGAAAGAAAWNKYNSWLESMVLEIIK